MPDNHMYQLRNCELLPITWPFAVWGLDMVVPLQKAPCGFTRLLVVVNKFTKWIEAKPIKNLDGAAARRFVQDLVVRFGPQRASSPAGGTGWGGGVGGGVGGGRASDLT